MRAVFPARDCGWNHLDTSPSGIKNSFPALPSHRPPGLFHGNFNVLPWKSRYGRVHSLQFFHNLNIKLEREREKVCFLIIRNFLVLILVEGDRRILGILSCQDILFPPTRKLDFLKKNLRYLRHVRKTEKRVRWKKKVLKDVRNTFAYLISKTPSAYRMKLIKE